MMVVMLFTLLLLRHTCSAADGFSSFSFGGMPSGFNTRVDNEGYYKVSGSWCAPHGFNLGLLCWRTTLSAQHVVRPHER